MASPRILLVGGGSAGHLAPLVAVWRELQALRPEAEAFALASNRGHDREFLRQEDIDAVIVPYPWRSIILPWTLIMIFARGWATISHFRPTVVFSKGGLISVPVALAARLRGVPIVVHESDVIMGLGTSVVRRLATAVCLGIDPGQPGRAIVTGNPVRPLILHGDRARGLAHTGLSGHKPIVFITGGSQGAEAINRAVLANLPALLAHVDIIHLTGKGKSCSPKQPGYFSAEQSGGTMGDLFACAALTIIRGGAGSIAECAATGTPAVIVPIEGLAQDHQVHNAERAAASDGCIFLRQTDLELHLTPLIITLVQDPARLAGMKEAIKSLYVPEAAKRIAEVILRLNESGSAQP